MSAKAERTSNTFDLPADAVDAAPLPAPCSLLVDVLNFLNPGRIVDQQPDFLTLEIEELARRCYSAVHRIPDAESYGLIAAAVARIREKRPDFDQYRDAMKRVAVFVPGSLSLACDVTLEAYLERLYIGAKFPGFLETGDRVAPGVESEKPQ
jgi:hypothetical protein